MNCDLGGTQVGFIGPGKAGVSLGRYFNYKGIQLSGFYGKNTNPAQAGTNPARQATNSSQKCINSARQGAEATKSKFYENFQDIIEDSDILFITTPDDIIPIIDSELSKFPLSSKSVCHISGSLKSDVLYNSKNSGALIYSIHPIFAFSSKDTNLNELEKIYFSIEGDISGNCPVINLMKKLGNNYFIRDKEDAALYHLANVFVSNLILSLLSKGTSYFMELGLSENEALNALKPLVEGNIKSIFEKGFVDSLTGPVSRGDVSTVKKHLSVLKAEDKDLYKNLSLNLLKLTAMKKNIRNLAGKGLTEDLPADSANYSEIYKILGGSD